MKNIHIGSLIEEKFNKRIEYDKQFNKTKFAELIHVHRSTIYPIFKQKSIDIDLLIRISKVLEYDFLAEYRNKENDENEYKIIVGIKITKYRL